MEMSSFVLIKMSRMINNKVNINIDVFVFWTTLHTISRQCQYLSTCASLDELGVIRGGQIFPLWKQSVNTRIFHDSHDIGLLFKPGRRLPLQALLSEKLNLVILLFLFSPLLCWALCCTPTPPRWTPLPLLFLLLNIMFVVLTLVGHPLGDQPTLFGHLVGDQPTLFGHLVGNWLSDSPLLDTCRLRSRSILFPTRILVLRAVQLCLKNINI